MPNDPAIDSNDFPRGVLWATIAALAGAVAAIFYTNRLYSGASADSFCGLVLFVLVPVWAILGIVFGGTASWLYRRAEKVWLDAYVGLTLGLFTGGVAGLYFDDVSELSGISFPIALAAGIGGAVLGNFRWPRRQPKVAVVLGLASIALAVFCGWNGIRDLHAITTLTVPIQFGGQPIYSPIVPAGVAVSSYLVFDAPADQAGKCLTGEAPAEACRESTRLQPGEVFVEAYFFSDQLGYHRISQSRWQDSQPRAGRWKIGPTQPQNMEFRLELVSGPSTTVLNRLHPKLVLEADARQTRLAQPADGRRRREQPPWSLLWAADFALLGAAIVFGSFQPRTESTS